MSGNGESDDDFTTPVERRFHVVNPANEAVVYVIADLALAVTKGAQALDGMRLEVALQARPLGPEGLAKITDRLVATAGDYDQAAEAVDRLAKGKR